MRANIYGMLKKMRPKARLSSGMGTFRIALENERWDLAAHVLVFSALNLKVSEGKDGRKKRPHGQPKRP